MRKPIEKTINTPLETDIVGGSGSVPFVSTSGRTRDDFDVEDTLADDDDSERCNSGARSPEPLASPMMNE